MQWLIDNREWVFSGIGIFIFGLLITYFKNEDKDLIKQKQKSGKNSINIQVGGNVELNKKDNE
jgi:hypothetical protein